MTMMRVISRAPYTTRHCRCGYLHKPTGSYGVSPGHQRRPAGGAESLGSQMMRQSDSLTRDPVDVRRAYRIVAETADVADSQIVGDENNDIRSVFWLGRSFSETGLVGFAKDSGQVKKKN